MNLAVKSTARVLFQSIDRFYDRLVFLRY